MAVQLIRVVLVIALVVAAAALATPKGRLPLALRGMMKVLGKRTKDREREEDETVPGWKRFLAFGLVLMAVLVALV